jgi:small subunit ribosomal protein S10
MAEKKNQLKITLSGYDVATIEEATSLVTEEISRLKLNFNGPIPFPNRKKSATLIISPHKHKSSQEHLMQETHRRVIQIFNFSPTDLDNLENLRPKIANTVLLSLKSSL